MQKWQIDMWHPNKYLCLKIISVISAADVSKKTCYPKTNGKQLLPIFTALQQYIKRWPDNEACLNLVPDLADGAFSLRRCRKSVLRTSRCSDVTVNELPRQQNGAGNGDISWGFVQPKCANLSLQYVPVFCSPADVQGFGSDLSHVWTFVGNKGAASFWNIVVAHRIAWWHYKCDCFCCCASVSR